MRSLNSVSSGVIGSIELGEVSTMDDTLVVSSSCRSVVVVASSPGLVDIPSEAVDSIANTDNGVLSKVMNDTEEVDCVVCKVLV